MFVKYTFQFEGYQCLKRAFVFYLLLGVTDTVHHLHAAVALGQSSALHAFWAGLILVPIATLLVLKYITSKNRYLLWGFFAIASLATLLPGLYHGGWDHLVKILAYVKINGESTNVKSLLPAENYNLWFYEFTGSLEFVFAIFLAFYLCKVIQKSSEQIVA